LLHVAPAVPPRAAAVLDKSVLQAHYTEESDKVFKPLRTFFAKQKIAAEFVAKVGAAADTIASLADKGKFDLVMMGSHGHGMLASVVTGSVVVRVLARCQTPVLIVR
jgi:nucleotide-binding universal stress UspA family protein